MKENELAFKEKTDGQLENCLCFCEEEINREAPFRVPVEIPEGFAVAPAEAEAAVVWNPDHLSCVLEPCLIQTDPSRNDIGVIYAVRLQGTITLLVSVSPVRNQYGQGNGAVSVLHATDIDQVVYYTEKADDCPDLSQVTIKNIAVVPPFYGSPLSVTGTIVLVPDPEPVYAFTSNSNDQSVSVIDTNTHTVVTKISLPYQPYGIEVTPDKAYTFVLHYDHNMISVIDNRTLIVTASVLLDQQPESIAFLPEHEFAYVLAGTSIFVVRLSTLTVERSIVIEGNPASLAVDPNGLYAYVIDVSSASVVRIDLNTGDVTGTIPRDLILRSIEIDSPERYAYVLEQEFFFNYISIIDLDTFTIVTTIELEYEGEYRLFTGGSEVYLFDDFSHNVYAVSPNGAAVLGHLSEPAVVSDLAFIPNGQYLYTTHWTEQTITVYHTEDYSVAAVISLGVSPNEIAI
ncbi:YncE family protein [Bacillus sp. ISL-51]|uniref:YncE family protein n=1 Tax=Bacteria TaxID=2 RepID=UPI001BE85C61|nr:MULTISPECIES: YncE family protein [Bacteria]MBT2573064.1 YncE family protein [Bacillus sp. ISL-51]MBT2633981.1 YncE family protein [Bacillus sp. ISL-26]MBT2713538.1 YncE family protein [Pseudomonas sp. ISL-88]